MADLTSMTPEQFAAIAAVAGFPQEETIAELQKHPWHLGERAAREQVLTIVRARQELDITDDFEHIIEEVVRRGEG